MSTATTECSYWLVAPASRNLSSVHQLALAHAVGAHIWISSFRVWTPPPAPSRFGRDPQTNFLPHAVEPVLGARVPAASAPGAGLRALQLSGSHAVVMKSVPPRKAASPELNLPMPSLRVSFLVAAHVGLFTTINSAFIYHCHTQSHPCLPSRIPRQSLAYL
jgi:hypothetical protein